MGNGEIVKRLNREKAKEAEKAKKAERVNLLICEFANRPFYRFTF